MLRIEFGRQEWKQGDGTGGSCTTQMRDTVTQSWAAEAEVLRCGRSLTKIWMDVVLLLLSRFSHVRLCATHRQKSTKLSRPWDSPGKNTGVGCHFLLHAWKWKVKVKSLSRVRPYGRGRGCQTALQSSCINLSSHEQRRLPVSPHPGPANTWQTPGALPH